MKMDNEIQEDKKHRLELRKRDLEGLVYNYRNFFEHKGQDLLVLIYHETDGRRAGILKGVWDIGDSPKDLQGYLMDVELNPLRKKVNPEKYYISFSEKEIEDVENDCNVSMLRGIRQLIDEEMVEEYNVLAQTLDNLESEIYVTRRGQETREDDKL
jgi:hypothetical protein